MQLEIIRFLQLLNHPFFVKTIKFLDFFDRQEFLFVFIPVIWMKFGVRNGIKLFYLLLLSLVFNFALKNIFCFPRPFHIEEGLGIHPVEGYGFPSGAAQTSILLAGLLVLHWKSNWRWLAGIAYVLLIAFSRIYLGVHFPTDILGGWLAGSILLCSYIYLSPKLENWLCSFKPLSLLICSTLLLGIIVFFFPFPNFIRIFSAAIGINIGLTVIRFYPFNISQNKIIIDICACIAGAIIIYKIFEVISIPFSFIHMFFQYSAIGCWLSIASKVCFQIHSSFKNQSDAKSNKQL